MVSVKKPERQTAEEKDNDKEDNFNDTPSKESRKFPSVTLKDRENLYADVHEKSRKRQT